MRQDKAARVLLLLLALLVGFCEGEEAAPESQEKEGDSKATESQEVKVKTETEQATEKGKRAPAASLTAVPSSINSITAAAPAHAKVMIMPPLSLMLAMPHPSGRFLMLFPTTQLVPIVPMPYAQMPSQGQLHQQQQQHQQQQHLAASTSNHEHPAMFTARQQMLYNNPTYQPPREHHHHQNSYYSQPHPYHHTQSYPGHGGYPSKREMSVN